MQERTRDIMWGIFLGLFAWFNALLTCGLFMTSVREWREGHPVIAVLYPFVVVGSLWLFLRYRQRNPYR